MYTVKKVVSFMKISRYFRDSEFNSGDGFCSPLFCLYCKTRMGSMHHVQEKFMVPRTPREAIHEGNGIKVTCGMDD